MQAWSPGSEDSIGQAGEFLVWAALIAQSGGGLHVFLPTLDRGIDAVVHRLQDRALVPDPATYIVALAWVVPEERFHETCLLIPSEVLPSIAGTSGPNYELHFRPDGSTEPSKVDRYRIPLERLAEEISKRLEN